MKIVNANALNLPFENNHFDLITSNPGINNFREPQKALNECFRVLKPNGEIFITTNTVGHMRLFYSIYEVVLKNEGLAESISGLKKQEAHRKTAEKFAEMFRKAGFQISKTTNENLTLRYLDGSAFLRHSLTISGFIVGWRSILKKEEEAAVFKKTEERLNEIAAKKGELRMDIPMLLIQAKKD